MVLHENETEDEDLYPVPLTRRNRPKIQEKEEESDEDSVDYSDSLIDTLNEKYELETALAVDLNMNRLSPKHNLDRELITDQTRDKVPGIIEPKFFARHDSMSLWRFRGSAVVRTSPTVLDQEEELTFLLGDRKSRFRITGTIEIAKTVTKNNGLRGKIEWLIAIKPYTITDERQETLYRLGYHRAIDDLNINTNLIYGYTKCHSRRLKLIKSLKKQISCIVCNSSGCSDISPYGSLFASQVTILADY